MPRRERAMPRLRKAARGKRRWLGLEVDSVFSTRDDLQEVLERIPALGEDWRLYDFKDNSAIVRVRLEHYADSRAVLEPGFEGVRCVTASGKIRLVRERLGIDRPPRRR